MLEGLAVSAIYATCAGTLLALIRAQVAILYGVAGTPTAGLVEFYCLLSGPIWLFFGLLLVSNAAFSNLGFPFLATIFNWGRATLGVAPAALSAAYFKTPEAAMVGIAFGFAAFGSIATIACFGCLRSMKWTADIGPNVKM